jgi:hypothetical protein
MTEDFSEEKVVIRAPAGTMLAIEQAAIRARLRPSEFVRCVLLSALADKHWGEVEDPERRGRPHF